MGSTVPGGHGHLGKAHHRQDSSWRLSVLQGPRQAGRIPTFPHFLEGHEKAQCGGTGQGCPARLSGLYQQAGKTLGDLGSQNNNYGAEAAQSQGRKAYAPGEPEATEGPPGCRTAMQVGVMPTGEAW